MNHEVLGEMFEGDFADTCSTKMSGPPSAQVEMFQTSVTFSYTLDLSYCSNTLEVTHHRVFVKEMPNQYHRIMSFKASLKFI